MDVRKKYAESMIDEARVDLRAAEQLLESGLFARVCRTLRRLPKRQPRQC